MEKISIPVLFFFQTADGTISGRVLKHCHCIYFLTSEKANCAAEVCSPDLLDRGEPRNAGVVSDHGFGTFNGFMLRRIAYTRCLQNRYGVAEASALAFP